MFSLHCCTWAFSSCGEWGLLFVAVCGLLIAVASLCFRAWALGTRASVVVARRLSSCDAWAQLLRDMWDLPGPGHEPVSSALTGGFLTTAPPGKSPFFKSSLNLLQYWFCFMIWVFGREACGILSPRRGIGPHPLHWKVKS